MTLHDFVERAVGLAVTAVFAVGLGLLVHDAYVYLYAGAVDWFTSDLVMDQLAGGVCSTSVKWVALCDMMGRVHVGLFLVVVGPLLITLLGAMILALQVLVGRVIVLSRHGLTIQGRWQPLG
jgi:hypothetical protein